MEFKDDFFKKVEKKTKVDKNSLFALFSNIIKKILSFFDYLYKKYNQNYTA